MSGCLFIIAAPSGTGKTSLVKYLVTDLDRLHISVSHTTRPPRPGEEANKDYFFIEEDQFKQMIAADDFIEHAEIYGYRYGTSKLSVIPHLQAGSDVILEIDWQGARQIRQQSFKCCSIFVLPPSPQVLTERLQKRRQDSQKVMITRLQGASREIAHAQEFDYLVVNDDFDLACRDASAIITAQRLRVDVTAARYRQLIGQWISP